ncbi:uncharacterized protein G2W53_042033 [Senna tora]|uniref:Uncharacterized protein n=1 Tax=Senna tora TaxID=362788 RepID=A0A834SKY0_9FABA|nr:uncharacterized protein G2W53_042033 [Senna tora]
MISVANLHASRDDVDSSKRPYLSWSAAWDYATSLGWRGLSVKQLYGPISDMNNLLIALSNGAEQIIVSGSIEVLRPCWAIATSGVPARFPMSKHITFNIEARRLSFSDVTIPISF